MLHTEVRVKGAIEKECADWFEDLAVAAYSPDETVLIGDLPDQAALYGLISRLRDLRFDLRSVQCCETTGSCRSSVPVVVSQHQLKGESTMHSHREGIPVIFQAGSAYGRQIEWGDMDGGFWAFPAGFDSTPLFVGLPDGCECPHWGYLLKGRMRVKYADHEEIITAGEAYYLAPGHLPVMEEDCEMVEFSPKDESRKMLAFAGRSMAAR